MKKRELDKIIQKIDRTYFPANFSAQILKSFKPQFELTNSIYKQFDSIKNYQKLFEDTFPHQFLNSIRQQLGTINQSSFKFIEQNRIAFESISKSIIPLQNSINQSLAITNNFTRTILPQLNVFEELSRNIFSSHQSAYKNFSEILNRDLINVKNIISQIDFSHITDQINYLKNVSQQLNFGHNVIQCIEEINREDEIDYIISEVEKLLIEQIAKNNPSYVGSSFFQNLLFFIFSIIFMVYQGRIQEENIINNISVSEKRIVEKIERITPKVSLSEKYIYIVRTKLNVRNQPSSKSSILDCLFPNNKVEFIKADGNWFYVQYFDFLDGLPKYGWVYSKYLISKNAN